MHSLLSSLSSIQYSHTATHNPYRLFSSMLSHSSQNKVLINPDKDRRRKCNEEIKKLIKRKLNAHAQHIIRFWTVLFDYHFFFTPLHLKHHWEEYRDFRYFLYARLCIFTYTMGWHWLLIISCLGIENATTTTTISTTKKIVAHSHHALLMA